MGLKLTLRCTQSVVDLKVHGNIFKAKFAFSFGDN